MGPHNPRGTLTAEEVASALTCFSSFMEENEVSTDSASAENVVDCVPGSDVEESTDESNPTYLTTEDIKIPEGD